MNRKILIFTLSLVATLSSILTTIYFYSMTPKLEQKILTKAIKQLEICGDNYYFAWIDIDASNKTYNFYDVLGCRSAGIDSCVFSVKNTQLNLFYQAKNTSVDDNTFRFLSNLKQGTAGYYPDYKIAFNKLDLSTLQDVLVNTNVQIRGGGLSVIKNNNVLKGVFALSFSDDFEKKGCDKSDLIKFLEDISKEASNEF